MLDKKDTINQRGLALLEVVFGIAILAFVSLSLYGLFDFTIRIVWENRARAGAQALANAQLETARNLPYIDVGTQGGIPLGVLPQVATTSLNNIEYTVSTSVIYVDDPFDGVQGGNPDDPLPADYKRVRLEIAWQYRIQSEPVVFISDVAPRGLESELGGGTLRLTALDSLGQAVPQAVMHIENNSTTPAINLDILANSSGQVLLPGATTSIESYEVIVTKTGFSVDQTYGVDPVFLATPIKPHLSVLEGEVSDASFSIDRLSNLQVSTVLGSDSCQDLGLVPGQGNLAGLADDEKTYTPYKSYKPYKSYRSDRSYRSDNAHTAAASADFYIALQDQIYVNGLTGNDTTGDGSSLNPYASLNRALQDVDQGEGDVVYLAGAQTYNEGTWTLDSIFSGATTTPTIIQSWPGTATPTLTTVGSQVFILDDVEHIKLEGLAITGASAEGILVQGSSTDVTISRSEISNNSGPGVRLAGDGANTLIENTIANNGGQGILLESSVNTIQRNIIHGNTGVGMLLSWATNDIIENTLYLNELGLDIVSSNNLINNNILYQHDQSGILIRHNSGQNTVTNNVSFDNGGHGLETTGNGTSLVSGNQAFDNIGFGISISGSDNTLNGNLLHGNGAGGLEIVGSDNTVDGGDVYENDNHGVLLTGGTGNSLQNLTVRLNDLTGVRLSSCAACAVSGSLIHGNISHGLEAISSADLLVQNNTLYGNSGRGVKWTASDDGQIDHNLIFRQGSSGLELDASSNNTISNNTLAQNGVDGINLLNSSIGNMITNNIISHNSGQGLDDEDNTSEPSDTYNLFYSNSLGDMRNLTPVAGGVGTLTGQDPLYVSLAGDNYHLQSIRGYYPFGSGDMSAQHSPAIDAADPVTGYTNELSPNGCTGNLGAYGNTAEASKSQEAGDPVPNLAFSLRGAKLKGWDAGGAPVHKYEQSLMTDATGAKSISNLEWDSYILAVSATTTGYDIAYLDPFQPINLLPNTTVNLEIGLVGDTAHSLHLLVIDSADGQPEENATVRLYHAGLSYDESQDTPAHGQVFFPNLSAATYTLEVTKGGFQFFQASVLVSGYSSETVSLTL